MKMLVTDYDNTFHIKDCDMIENVKKAKEFMNNNIFVIATGRSYNSYNTQKALFDIETNYLIINHGATILKDDNIIYNKSIDNDVKNEMLKYLNLDFAKVVFCYSAKDEVSIDTDNLTKIILEYYDKQETFKVAELIKEKFNNKVNVFLFPLHNSLEIISSAVDKSNAIDIISKLENIDEIYTIGDNHNDFLMIKKYHGYCTEVAVKEVKDIAIKQYKNVSDLICEIME